MDEWFESLLVFLSDHGWTEVFAAHGWDLRPESAEAELADLR